MLRNLLLIDDDLSYARMLAIYLKGLNYNVEIAQSAAEAKNISAGFPADCVLLDYNLPDINGDRVLAIIRGDPEIYKVPVILISGDETLEELAVRKYGADGFYFKSDKLDKCLSLIEAVRRRVLTERNVRVKDDIRIEKEHYAVYRNQKLAVNLSEDQFRLLDLLLFKSPEYVPESLIAKIVFSAVEYEDKHDAIRNLAFRLRQNLGKQLGNRIRSNSEMGWAYISPQE